MDTAPQILRELFQEYGYNVTSHEKAVRAAEEEDFLQFKEFLNSMSEQEYEEFRQEALENVEKFRMADRDDRKS